MKKSEGKKGGTPFHLQAQEGGPLSSIEKKSQDYLKKWSETLPSESPSPYLRTRVGAQFDEHFRNKRARSWKWAPVLAGALGLLFAGVWIGGTLNERRAELSLNQPVEISIRVTEAEAKQIGKVTVELPLGMQFFLGPQEGIAPEARAELEKRIAGMHTLDLEVTPEIAASGLPILVSGSSPGMKRVRLKFYDPQGDLVAERDREIRFKGESI